MVRNKGPEPTRNIWLFSRGGDAGAARTTLDFRTWPELEHFGSTLEISELTLSTEQWQLPMMEEPL